MRRFVIAWLALASLLFAGAARAQESGLAKIVTKRKAELATRAHWVLMTVGYRDVVNARVRQKLLSGLPTTIITRAYVFPEDQPSPTTLSAKTCRVVFDLWDEVFRIELHHSGKRRATVAVNVEGVLRRCAEAHLMPVVEETALRPQGRYFVAVLVEVNPLSKEMMAKIKRWVARPQGAGAVSPGDSLFGSFVGLFVTHVPDADRTLAFRTQTFVPASLPKLPEKKDKKKDDDSEERASR
jgi:hypothetical protein